MILPVERAKKACGGDTSCGCGCSQQEPEGESYMSLQALRAMQEHAAELLDQLDPQSALPDWVESKLTGASQSLTDVYEYMSHGQKYAASWTPESRLVDALNKADAAVTQLGWLMRETPLARADLQKALKLLEAGVQILQRDVARELSLPSMITASAPRPKRADLADDLKQFNQQHPYHNDLDLISSRRETKVGTGTFEISPRRALVLERAGLVEVMGNQYGEKLLRLTAKGRRSLDQSSDDFSQL